MGTLQEQRTLLRIKDLKSAATLDAEETAKEKKREEMKKALQVLQKLAMDKNFQGWINKIANK
tara:strand:- start:47 stop:235 length:189 start_codon:yes stop_codon:yes gene_type:complete